MITADSVPVFDAWGFGDYWSCDEWKLWHKLNVDAYGAATANNKFITAWNQQDAFASPYNWCKYESNFTSYFKGYGIDLGHIISDGVIIVGNAVEATGSVVDSAGNTASILKWAIPLAVIIALIIASMWAYKNFAKG
jgi:hypothetical protein